jgi:pimeloyl-ACP methyl ester carboxylesterase
LNINHCIEHQDSKLYYNKYGSGEKSILLFHGFGQTHQMFQSWIEAFQNDYTLYAFDLYFHGESVWASREPLEKSDWKNILEQFVRQEQLARFEVAGFSMGGKFALATLELFPERVEKMYLLAPDGIKTSFWYSLATYPIATRYFFKGMILHPNRLHSLAKMLRAFRLVDSGLLRFAEYQMNSEEKRRRVYCSWVYFRHLKFDLDKITSLLNQKEIPLTMMVGKFDKVIQAKNMEGFLFRIKNKEYKILEAGHNDLIAKSMEAIKKQNDSLC